VSFLSNAFALEGALNDWYSHLSAMGLKPTHQVDQDADVGQVLALQPFDLGE
jgi:hypothetical protein